MGIRSVPIWFRPAIGYSSSGQNLERSSTSRDHFADLAMYGNAEMRAFITDPPFEIGRIVPILEAQTTGLLSRGPQVRVLPGAPFLATFRRSVDSHRGVWRDSTSYRDRSEPTN